MRRLALILLGVLALFANPSLAQTRRALVIGIDHYSLYGPTNAGISSSASVSGAAAASTSPAPSEQRPFVTDLAGARADARAIADLLQAKYGFEAANVRLLLDSAATRAGIIAAIENLTRASQRGDVVAVYYAGHGAQRYNSKSWKPTHLDQTIVPVNANTGVFDIRDKELAVMFDSLLDKGVTLTLIFDSCHSGSITRGGGLVRLAGIDSRDSRDDSRPTAPEERGALVLSAAQDDQTAAEAHDPDGQDHGAFTSALIRVLRATPNNEPAHQIYQRVKAMVQSDGNAQEPVIKGTEVNPRRPLFGDVSGDLGGRITVALRRVDADTALLQGGLALGFGPGTELVQLDPSKGKTAAAPVRLKVVAVTGMSSSRATAISGKAVKVAPGTLFVVDKWSPPDRPALRVFIPPAVTVAQLDGLTRSLGELRTSAALEWVDDPSAITDDGRQLYLVFPTKAGWKARSPLGTTAPIVAPTAADVSAAVALLAAEFAKRAAQDSLAARSSANGAPPKPRVFVVLPSATQVRSAIHVGAGSANNAIALVELPDSADYVLAGRLTGEGTTYAWLRPDATPAEQKGTSLPARTTWFTSAQAADSLEDRVIRLGRINGWLTLDSPPQDEFFPYQLALRNVQSGEMKTSGGETYGGDRYDLILRRDTTQHPQLVSRRWVYVFAIDSYGKGTPLYPQSGTVENRVPFDSVDVKALMPAEIKLPRRNPVPIGPPYGVDTWLLVTSDEPIDVETFRFEGVRTRGGARGGLSSLLSRVGGATRGTPEDAPPTNWSVQRITLLSRAKPAGGSGN